MSLDSVSTNTLLKEGANNIRDRLYLLRKEIAIVLRQRSLFLKPDRAH